jgi:hypothetical protein
VPDTQVVDIRPNSEDWRVDIGDFRQIVVSGVGWSGWARQIPWEVALLRSWEGMMKKYVIERALPGIGDSSPEDLRAAAQKSNEVLEELGPDIQWVESYVVNDMTLCIYMARDEDIIREHAEKSGFPATKITEVRTMIGPATAEA